MVWLRVRVVASAPIRFINSFWQVSCYIFTDRRKDRRTFIATYPCLDCEEACLRTLPISLRTC